MNYSNRAGKSTRTMAKKRGFMAIWLILIGMIAVIIIGALLQNYKSVGIGGGGILVLLIVLRVLPDFIEDISKKKFKEEKRATRGAIGKRKLGKSSGLTSDFYILHDITSPYGNIDHIVISKNGDIFLLETKAHGGKVTSSGNMLLVNGKQPEKDFISQTLRNSYWLRDKVNDTINIIPWITPIIVFTNAFVPPIKPIKGVAVINKKYLNSFLQKVRKPSTSTKCIWEKKEMISNCLM